MTARSTSTIPPEQARLLRWTAGMGAVTAEALAERERCSVASARSRLLAASRRGWLEYTRPVNAQPALYTATSAGLRAAGVRGLERCRISPSNAVHAIVCAHVAAALGHCYPEHRVLGERELRRDEREHGRPLASARMGSGVHGELLHRPDLVLWPHPDLEELPVAVEVELTLKAPRRLLSICRAWARCRDLGGVVYLASPEVLGALGRAVEQAHAQERIAVLPLDAVPHAPGSPHPTKAL